MQTNDEFLASFLNSNEFAPGIGPGQAYVIVRMIAVNPQTPSTVLEKIADHCTDDILEQIAANCSSPQCILDKLSQHCCASVRAAVADNPETSLETLERLARDESVDVRYEVAENHNLPLSILTILCEDENPYVAFRAQQTVERIRLKKGRVLNTVKNWVGKLKQAKHL